AEDRRQRDVLATGAAHRRDVLDFGRVREAFRRDLSEVRPVVRDRVRVAQARPLQRGHALEQELIERRPARVRVVRFRLTRARSPRRNAGEERDHGALVTAAVADHGRQAANHGHVGPEALIGERPQHLRAAHAARRRFPQRIVRSRHDPDRPVRDQQPARRPHALRRTLQVAEHDLEADAPANCGQERAAPEPMRRHGAALRSENAGAAAVARTRSANVLPPALWYRWTTSAVAQPGCCADSGTSTVVAGSSIAYYNTVRALQFVTAGSPARRAASSTPFLTPPPIMPGSVGCASIGRPWSSTVRKRPMPS